MFTNRKTLFIVALVVMTMVSACASAAPATPNWESTVQAFQAGSASAGQPAEPAESGWVHNPVLGAPSGYPGWVRMLGQQQSDGLNRLVELTLRTSEVALIFGDSATIDPIGVVGGQWTKGSTISGCYLVVIEGPMVYDTQPATGEHPPFTWPGRSAWDAHVTDGSANPLVWASQKVADLRVSYPETCGKSVDVWVFTQP